MKKNKKTGKCTAKEGKEKVFHEGEISQLIHMLLRG